MTIRTTDGDIAPPEDGYVLAHEHVHTDLKSVRDGGGRQATVAEIEETTLPKLERAAAAGVKLLIECTPPYVGYHPEAVHAVTTAAGIALVVATGLYKDEYQPDWAHRAKEAALAEWMEGALTEGWAGGWKAGFIKLAVTDQGVTDQERKVLRAAITASRSTGAPIAVHCPVGANALEYLDEMAAAGLDADRFLQVHAHAEDDFDIHLEVLRRGGWIEYDLIGSKRFTDDFFVKLIWRVLEAGFGDRLLLSQDVCGYLVDRDPPFDMREYAYLFTDFVPRLAVSGVGAGDRDRLLRANPGKFFSLRK
ncbi:MAG: esterase [Chloroflexota bacterium]|jgi:phosphotriesterase-related protein|nr:esterase [Chloroflexota bacterium]MDP6507629.1 esterase [Chloroflexota bacterium]MDP6757347.1 esterase [Chloroflexota bacterium]